jgi:maltooligosyltrehalose trehalohydrolase
VQNSYGGPEGLKKFVAACHRKDIAVVLDVVYNHFGPEGAYIGQFGPYFTDKYKTPWGKAINFDDAFSDHVRNYFVQNALHWFKHYHIDALRLDAIHAIYDFSAVPFLAELSSQVDSYSHETGRKYYLIAESDLNDAKIVRGTANGGFGLDAQWCDDFHHSLHVALTGEDQGYYSGFGGACDLAKSFKDGFVYEWDYAEARQRHFGSDSHDVPGRNFIVFAQNHDQVGNRMLGERLTSLVDFEGLKLAAASVLLSPYVPLVFMGEEYGEEAPFLYFVEHSDRNLIRAVQQGRKDEFAAFNWQSEPPDPQSESTFLESKLNWERRKSGSHKVLLEFYKKLIEIRNCLPALALLDKKSMEVECDGEGEIVAVKRWNGSNCVLLLLNFKQESVSVRRADAGKWVKILDSADRRWGGGGSDAPDAFKAGNELNLNRLSAVLYQMERA